MRSGRWKNKLRGAEEEPRILTMERRKTEAEGLTLASRRLEPISISLDFLLIPWSSL